MYLRPDTVIEKHPFKETNCIFVAFLQWGRKESILQQTLSMTAEKRKQIHRILLDYFSKLGECRLQPDESNISPGNEIQSTVIPNIFVQSPTPWDFSQRICEKRARLSQGLVVTANLVLCKILSHLQSVPGYEPRKFISDVTFLPSIWDTKTLTASFLLLLLGWQGMQEI